MEDEKYRVILHRIGENSEEEKNRFCEEISKNYGIPLPLMKKIAGRCPIVIKKDLTLKKAEVLAIALQSFGASVSVQRKRDLPPVSLEPIEGKPYRLGLESSSLRRSPGGVWQLFGKVQNISKEEFHDIWALIQVFDEHGELITFEEIPLPFTSLPPNESSPFKALLEKDLPLQNISIAFKTASGKPISAVDKRNKSEWVEVKIADSLKRISPLSAVEISEEVLSPLEQPFSCILEEKDRECERQEAERAPANLPPLLVETISAIPAEKIEGSGEEAALTFFEKESGLLEKDQEEDKNRLDIPEAVTLSQDISQTPTVVESLEEDLHLDVSMDEPLEGPPESERDLLFLEKEGPVKEDTLASAQPKTEDHPFLYDRLDDFKRAIEVYEQENRDPFLPWFEHLQEEGILKDPYHSVLTLLIYARFNQTHPSNTALENTQRVFHLAIQADLSTDRIPPLKGDLFFPSDIWRDLYIRAIPKLQEVSRRILDNRGWHLLDLDRLIRIIPHMTARNSRWVIRTLHHWMPEIVPDVSEMSLDINDALYRIASRLGVVNPLFDYFQGKNSMGNQKIQAFARATFPNDPGKIEEPMSRLGADDEKGHCLPTQPRCQGCPFEDFCPKLFFDFNPSEKGMILRS